MALRLRWPTEFGFITQGFLERPGFYGKYKYTGTDGKVYALPGHEGLDIRAPASSRVFACADGTVSLVRRDGNIDRDAFPYGNQVRIRHAEGYETIYAHLEEVRVEEGNQVRTGDVIGLADSTGNSSASHLHLTVKKKGASANGETIFKNDIIDPTPLLDPLEGGTLAARSTERNIPDFPLHGLHGTGAADWLRDNGVHGWAVETIFTTSDLANPEPVDFSTHEAAGVRVLVRWNYSFASADGGAGTYPPRARYDEFIEWCVQSIRASRGVWGHIIGNEPNRAGERPDYRDNVQPGTPILASDITYIVNGVWRHVPQTTRISPPAIDPTNVETDDPRKYWKEVLVDLEDVEFFALHAYSYGVDQPVNSNEHFDAPLGWQYHSFRMWEPIAQVLYSDSRFRSQPLIITETNHLLKNDGHTHGWEPGASPWVSSMYDYLQRWNSQPGDQFVHGACLYRLEGDDWRIHDKPQLLQAMRDNGTQPT
jgi:hypothetical protein